MNRSRAPLAAVLTGITLLAGCAQTPAGHAGHADHGAAGAAAPPAHAMGHTMAQMDTQMAAMRDMHTRMQRARTPEERQALMAEHTKLMHEGLAMMDRMGSMGHKGGMGGMGGMHRGRAASAPAGADGPHGAHGADPAAHLEKRLQMMESMLKMMAERIAPAPAQP
jgi:hypothetical protein